MKQFIKYYIKVFGFNPSAFFELVKSCSRKHFYADFCIFTNRFVMICEDVDKYGMWFEISLSMKGGLNFYQACEEWDII